MRAAGLVVLAFTLLLLGLAGLAAADGRRMTDAQGERYMWGGIKVTAPHVALEHPKVVKIAVEPPHVSLSPQALEKKPGPKFLAKVTVNVITRDVLSEAEIEALAAKVRDQAAYFHVVGVRFKQHGQSAADGGFYGWLLFWDGQATTRNIMTTAEAEKAAAGTISSVLLPGERLVGSWADINALPGGTIALTTRGNRLWLRLVHRDGSGADVRTRLRYDEKKKRWAGVYQDSDLGSFMTNGSDTDPIAISIDDPMLYVFDRGSTPWFVGKPKAELDLSLIPPREPRKDKAGYAKSERRFSSVSDALGCISRVAVKLPPEPSPVSRGAEYRIAADKREAAERREYRSCFTRSQIRDFGLLSAKAANAFVSCGYRKSPEADKLIWAALLADEDSLIDGWRTMRDSDVSVARGSPAAQALCPRLLARFGSSGSEFRGLIVAITQE